MCAGPISAAEPAAWGAEDAAWERLQLAALQALAANDLTAAAGSFQAALRLARAAFAPDDPRSAASLASHAACLAAAGEPAAGRLLAEAAALWRRAPRWLARQPLAARARSSTFHLRLERRHPGAYESGRRTALAQALAEVQAALDAAAAQGPGTIGAQDAAGILARWPARRPPTFDGARRLSAAAALLALPGPAGRGPAAPPPGGGPGPA
jgi:hypothetical protein